VKLHEGNVEPMLLWEHSYTQWRGAGMGIVGLDYDTVRFSVASTLGIRWSLGLFAKIRALEMFELARMRDDSGKSNSQRGERS
jgi:hypothetical protein